MSSRCDQRFFFQIRARVVTRGKVLILRVIGQKIGINELISVKLPPRKIPKLRRAKSQPSKQQFYSLVMVAIRNLPTRLTILIQFHNCGVNGAHTGSLHATRKIPISSVVQARETVRNDNNQKQAVTHSNKQQASIKP